MPANELIEERAKEIIGLLPEEDRQIVETYILSSAAAAVRGAKRFTTAAAWGLGVGGALVQVLALLVTVNHFDGLPECTDTGTEPACLACPEAEDPPTCTPPERPAWKESTIYSFKTDGMRCYAEHRQAEMLMCHRQWADVPLPDAPPVLDEDQ